MGTVEFNAGGNPRWTSIPSRGEGGGVQILLVASCYRNRDKLWPQARYRDGLQLARMQT